MCFLGNHLNNLYILTVREVIYNILGVLQKYKFVIVSEVFEYEYMNANILVNSEKRIRIVYPISSVRIHQSIRIKYSMTQVCRELSFAKTFEAGL